LSPRAASSPASSPSLPSPSSSSPTAGPPSLAANRHPTAPPGVAPSGALVGSSSTSAPRPPPQGMGARRAGMGMGLNPSGGPALRGPVLGGPKPNGTPGGAPMPPGLAAKLAAQRSANPGGGLRATPGGSSPGSTNSPVPPSLMNRPRGLPTASAPPATLGGLAARRAASNGAGAAGGPGVAGAPGPRLPGAAGTPPTGLSGRRFPPGRPAGGPGGMSLSSMNGGGGPGGMNLGQMGGLGPRKDAFSNFGKIVCVLPSPPLWNSNVVSRLTLRWLFLD
jgi:hypothetical protein